LRLLLTATGLDSKVELFRIGIDESGRWEYQSRAVEGLHGQLSESDRTQLARLYEQVDWDQEVLNLPVSADDRTLFALRIDDGDLQRTYQFSEAMNHASWQFRDLVHFLRHNVAMGGEPVGPVTGDQGRDAAQHWHA